MYFDRYRYLTDIEFSVFYNAENHARYPEWGFTVKKYCNNHNISKSKYYRIKRIADIKVLEACKQDAISYAIEAKKSQDIIYSTTLWGGGYNGMTPLEFRLAYNIPAKTFYKYSGLLSKRLDIPDLYPCDCLKRKPGRHRRNNTLSGSLEGWFSKSDCLHCKGTGITQFCYCQLIKSEFDKKRVLREIKESAKRTNGEFKRKPTMCLGFSESDKRRCFELKAKEKGKAE